MKSATITLSHGSGGRQMACLISDVFLARFNNRILNRLDDAAQLKAPKGDIAFTTDSYTVKPIFFPGGDIGKLAVCGTVNDLAVKGARPIALSVSFIIEEGFSIDALKKIVASMAQTAKHCRVAIVTGDTKVVRRGEADGIFINTAGIGSVHRQMNVSCSNARVGDAIIISGTLADHGICILNEREKLGFQPPIKSDVASVYPFVKSCVAFAPYLHVMRDPTRGGLASALHEIAKASRVGIRIFEEKIPVTKAVARACEILGMDYLSIANEGKLVLFVDTKKSKSIVARLRSTALGKKACIIGEVINGADVYLETKLSSKRLLPLLEGEALPRIC